MARHTEFEVTIMPPMLRHRARLAKSPKAVVFAVVTAVASLAVHGAAAQSSHEQFFTGKQIKLTTHVGPASGYSVWARLVAAHLGRHIPGAPSLVVQNMPGGGGMKAANYLYTMASKDGLELGAINRLTPTWSIMGSPGANFDSALFGWLGSPASDTNLCIVSKATPVRTVDDLMTKEVIVGTDGVGSGMHIFPTALNSVLGTKFKVIDGYKDTGDVMLAIDRGEIQGLCLSAETLTTMRGDYFKSGEWRPILQAGITVSPDFPDVPLALDRAKTTEQKQILKFLFESQSFGRPYLAPPGLPPERLAMLRKAFDETMRDPDFVADVTKSRLKVTPITGADMDRMIAEMKAAPKDIVAIVAKLMGSEAN
jgi:tripartite-type tricarboxylate transporter receptor subunit TctC